MIAAHRTLIPLLGLAVAVAACDTDTRAPAQVEGSTAKRINTKVASTAKPLPAAGRARYNFLLAEIPQLVDKVPCSCCPYSIGQCYRGACPETCGPCNEIGADVYAWHHEGLSDREVVKRVQQKYPRKKHER